MKFVTTIEFKSDEEFFNKEQSGVKNNTVRLVNSAEDIKILSILDDIKYIRIVNTNDIICTSSFVRTLTDITRYANPAAFSIIYIFTWER